MNLSFSRLLSGLRVTRTQLSMTAEGRRSLARMALCGYLSIVQVESYYGWYPAPGSTEVARYEQSTYAGSDQYS